MRPAFLRRRTPEVRLGLSLGQMLGGFALAAGGFTGEILGRVASATGVGAALGVPVMLLSAGLVTGGAGNMAAGVRGLMTTGSGLSTPRQPLQGAAPAATQGVRFPEKPGQIKHIFRDAPGHLADTPANRALLQGMADDASTTLGTDKFGNVWSARTLDDSTQVWVQTRNGVIQNGGLNQTPRVFNPEIGL